MLIYVEHQHIPQMRSVIHVLRAYIQRFDLTTGPSGNRTIYMLLLPTPRATISIRLDTTTATTVPEVERIESPRGVKALVPSASSHPHARTEGEEGGSYSIRRDVRHIDSAFAPLAVNPAAVECDAGVCAPGIFADAVEGGRDARECE